MWENSNVIINIKYYQKMFFNYDKIGKNRSKTNGIFFASKIDLKLKQICWNNNHLEYNAKV